VRSFFDCITTIKLRNLSQSFHTYYSPSRSSVSTNRLRNITGSIDFTTTALSAGMWVSTDRGTVRSKKITCP